MEITKVSNSIWSDLIRGKISCRIEFLGLQFLLIRLKMKISANDQPSVMNECINELKDYLYKIEKNPLIQKDLEKICGIGSMV